MELFESIVGEIDSFVWGWFMIVILLGTHLYMCVRTKFIQRKLGTAIKLSFTQQDKDAEGDVSQFGALTTALAATVGTGNIVGVGTGVLFGGPGAVFWMWITGVLGIATKYAENFISVKYRVKDSEGTMLGGAMYAAERGFKNKGFGKAVGLLFGIFAAIAAFGIGASTQSNSLTGIFQTNSLLSDTFFATTPGWVYGIVIVILVGVVILGGVKSVTRVCEKLVPFMAVIYMAMCIIILCINWQFIGEAFELILTCAFTGQAAFGGAVGSSLALALQYGFKRGLFSNESGMGSAPLVAANATTKNPARQALVSMTGTFWDTVVICLLTGLVLISSLCASPELQATYAAGGFESAAALSNACFNTVPIFGPLTIAVGMILFSYSTMLGWSHYGNRAITYLFGVKAIKPYYVIFLLFVFWGCVGGFTVVWDISDIFNALMVLPNAVCLWVLASVITKETQHYVYDGNLEEECTDEIPIYENK